MNITYYGLNCFKLQGKDVSIITDPFSKDVGLKPPFGASDIVTVSSDFDYYNNSSVVKGDPFIVDGAGEYEIKKVSVRGIDFGLNTVYKIVLDDIKICHLGSLCQENIENSQLNAIGDVDILFLPIGGGKVLDFKKSENIISQIEPKIVIPMHYFVNGMKDKNLNDMSNIEQFCKEHSIEKSDIVSKFNIKDKDLPQEDTQYIVIDLGK